MAGRGRESGRREEGGNKKTGRGRETRGREGIVLESIHISYLIDSLLCPKSKGNRVQSAHKTPKFSPAAHRRPRKRKKRALE